MKSKAAMLLVAVFSLFVAAVAVDSPAEGVDQVEADKPAEPVQPGEAVEAVEVDPTMNDTQALCSEDHMFVERGCAQESVEPDPLQAGDWVCTPDAECEPLPGKECIIKSGSTCWTQTSAPFDCCTCTDTAGECAIQDIPTCYPGCP